MGYILTKFITKVMHINIDPVAFYIFSLPIRWYALSYVFGIIIGSYIAKKVVVFRNSFDASFIDQFINWIIIGIIVGGRIGHIIFFDIEFFVLNPLEIFKVWNGGMSFHGGVIGVAFAGILFCKKYSISVIDLFDAIAVAAPIGLFFGRIANFINGELYGRFWSSKYAVCFADNVPRHPSQLYEAFSEGVVLFICEWLLLKRNPKKGTLAGVFCIMYSVARIVCENFRAPDTELNYMLFNSIGCSIGQLLSLPLILIGMWMTRRSHDKS